MPSINGTRINMDEQDEQDAKRWVVPNLVRWVFGSMGRNSGGVRAMPTVLVQGKQRL
jgi:hypothetical protein